MAVTLMPGELHDLSVAIGRLQEGQENLAEQFQRHVEETTREQRKVHEIVDATSEAVRNVARDVTAMKPVVERYQKEAAESRGEQRGEKRIKGLLYSVAAVAGSLLTVGAGKFIDWMTRHIPVVVIVVIALAIAGAKAFGQSNHTQHHASYQSLVNKADKGCCNNQDCGELSDSNERETATGTEVRIEGEWCPVQAFHYLKRGNAPDWSTAHVCVQHNYSGAKTSVCERLLCFQPKPGS